MKTDEPGIAGVKVRLVNNDKKRTEVTNVGAGSTAHRVLVTDENGLVKFEKVPKGRNFRLQILNAPEGSVATSKNKGGNKNGADDVDSDLNKDMTSDPFNLNKFTEYGTYNSMDMGLKLPKTVVVRVWNGMLISVLGSCLDSVTFFTFRS